MMSLISTSEKSFRWKIRRSSWLLTHLILVSVVLGTQSLTDASSLLSLNDGEEVGDLDAVGGLEGRGYRIGVGEESEEEEEEEENVGGVDPASWSDYLNTLFDPVFDPNVASNVSAVEGQTAHLVCRVNNLGTKTSMSEISSAFLKTDEAIELQYNVDMKVNVSWIRHRDTHILTVGSFTYTSDQRFSALHREGTNEWTLQIRQPTKRDTGLYECQVSTKPVRAYLVNLSVVVPTARILHAPELHADEGGALNLTCVVSPSPSPPEYIFWYHKGEVINYETDGSIEVNVRQGEGITVSTLWVARASLTLSGRYECAPSNTDRASIMVHVFKAEEPAAMHTSRGAVLLSLRRPSLFSVCSLSSVAVLSFLLQFFISVAFVT